MKNIILTLICCSMFSASAFAEEISSASSISKATVYIQGAKVERSAKVTIPSGNHEIVLTGLSNKIDQQSLQAKISGGVLLQSAVFRENYITPKNISKEIKIIQDSVENMEFDLELIKNQIEALKQEESLLLANKNIGGQNTGVSSTDLKEIAKYYAERLPVIKNNISTLQRKEKKKREVLTDYRHQLAELNRNMNKPSGEIILQVNSPSTKSVTVEFSYIVRDAGWYPSYDIRTKDIKNPVTLTYKANVWQNSGIDWDDVKLTVSTGNPVMSASRPILHPWYIGFYQYRQNQRNEVESVKNLAIPAPAQVQKDMDEDAAGYGAITDFIKVNVGQLNVEFDIDLKYDVPSDGKAHLVSMKEYELPAKYQYHAVPKLDKDAFLLAKVTEWERANLLPGQANIFFENSYIGQSYINPSNISDTLLLSFGRDKNIVVKREQLRDYTKTKFIGLNKKETYVYEITVRNGKSTPIEIEILENIPISKNSEIEVELEEKSGAEYVEETGKIMWRLNLAPNESKKLRLEFTVKYPKDKQLSGM